MEKPVDHVQWHQSPTGVSPRTTTVFMLHKWYSKYSEIKYQIICWWCFTLQKYQFRGRHSYFKRRLKCFSLMGKKWQMNFNPSKCECMIISNKSNLPTLTYSIDNIVIKQVEHAKYLGITIDQKLKWHKHINSVVKKGNSLYVFFTKKLEKFSNCCEILLLSNLFKTSYRVCISCMVTTLSVRYW